MSYFSSNTQQSKASPRLCSKWIRVKLVWILFLDRRMVVYLKQMCVFFFPYQIPMFGHATGKELYAEKSVPVYFSLLASPTEHSSAPGDL